MLRFETLSMLILLDHGTLDKSYLYFIVFPCLPLVTPFPNSPRTLTHGPFMLLKGKKMSLIGSGTHSLGVWEKSMMENRKPGYKAVVQFN